MMDTVLTVLAASLVGTLWGRRMPQVSAFRLTALAWYRRKRAVYVEILPDEGVWGVTDVLPEHPDPGGYSRYHRVEIDLSWFGVLPDSAWRAECERACDSLRLTRARLDQLRTALATALDAHPASTSDELLDELAKRDLNPWLEEVPSEDGWYLVAAQRPDIEPGAVHLSLYEVRGGSRQSWWSKARVAFRSVSVDSRVWASPSWSEARHQRRVDELLAASDAANAALLAAMDEEAAHRARVEAAMVEEATHRARVEEAKKRKDEAFEAWQAELSRAPWSG